MTTQIKAGVIAANAVNSSELASGALSGQNFTGDVTFDTTTLVVDSTNNRVGIGTTNPDADLHVKGAGATNIRLEQGNGSNYGQIKQNQSLQALQLGVGGDFAMTINSSGNVGIGTSSPSSGMQIKGDNKSLKVSSADYDIGFLGSAGSGGAGLDKGYFYLKNAGTTKIQLHSDGDSYFNGGNVGIGTNAPEGKLSVEADTSSNKLVAHFGSTTANRGIGFGQTETGTGGTGAIFGTNGDGTAIDQTIYMNTEGGTILMGAVPVGSASTAHVTIDGRGDSDTLRLSYDYGHPTMGSRGAHMTFQVGNSSASPSKITTNYWPGGSGDIEISAYNITSQLHLDTSGDTCFGKNTNDINTIGAHIICSGTYNGTYYSGITGSVSSTTYHVRDTTNNTWEFYVSNAGVISATSTSITSLSDERLKENIVELETGLNEVMALKPRRFDWIDRKEKNVAGFIAQEVEPVLPDLIGDFMHDDLDDAKSVKMADMIPTLVKAIQEQQTIIDDLKSRLDEAGL